MKTCSIKNEFYTITVSALGAELVSVKANDGFEYMWQSHADFWDSHAPILFPACGRLKNQKYTYRGIEYEMDMHGFIKDAEFAIASKEGSHITMTYSSGEKSKKIYPFDFAVIANYELRGEEIIFTFSITNKDTNAMPYMFGWHPGFALPTSEKIDIESYKLDFDAVGELNWFPLQNGPFVCPESKKYPLTDGCYKLCEEEIYKNDTMIFTGHKNKVALYADGESYRLDMSFTENLPYLCIWKDEFNAAKYICLEPWSSVPNDGVADENFDTRKMQRLAPNETEVFSYTLKFNH